MPDIGVKCAILTEEVASMTREEKQVLVAEIKKGEPDDTRWYNDDDRVFNHLIKIDMEAC